MLSNMQKLASAIARRRCHMRSLAESNAPADFAEGANLTLLHCSVPRAFFSLNFLLD
jgi:hypothetical protein